MKCIILLWFGLQATFCHCEDHATATFNQKQTSTAFGFDGVTKTPNYHHSTCYCDVEIYIHSDQERKQRSPSPVSVCYCCDCVSYSFDEYGNPKFHCQDTVLSEDGSNQSIGKRQISIRNSQQQRLRNFRRAHVSATRRQFNNPRLVKRSKRSPFDWDNFFDKISLMGSHDSTYTKRTEGYFHYNFAKNKSTTAAPTTTATSPTDTG
ncbi:uncharacterized protein LOC129765640 [Toxorhynchites rutilus septentrionalis]|uniref:uncharacterized protein LOC129765640 n=1 Tax=Toxorhynchites rutilus septentrionalis TaxID=329112 RepID=UPI00247AD7CF|nr:uncharacterized protein LOC129765640 [Toxorhynchites rutilus septentrionalis]